MIVKHNISLKPYNTFGIDAKADHFVSVEKLDDLVEILRLDQYSDIFVLGGGSNILFTQDISALVLHINLKGIEIISEDKNEVIVKAAAGENWHEFVLWCLDKNFGGLENLSLIPGNVGTAPIQNIGAYGVELKDHFVSCDTIEIATQQQYTFDHSQCKFGYRNSVFKQELKGKHIITHVTFKLSKQNHTLHTNYGDIALQLEQKHIDKPTIKDVSEAVITIRKSKLPDPEIIGNGGSFFKNPVISIEEFKSLKLKFPDMPNYPVSNSQVKIPAGWLIEKSGLKGKRFGNYGVHTKQALVLVNYGGALGSDILKLSNIIQNTIQRIFNISVEAEVNII